MRTDEDLPRRSPLHAREHGGNSPDNLRMKRKLGFLQQQWPRSVEYDPHQTEQSKRAVGQLLLALPSPLGTPVLVLPVEMRSSLRIWLKLKLLTESLLDSG